MTNQEPGRQAVALRYQPKRDDAPKLVAKRRGYLADKIIELARLHNIPIRQDKKLLQILSRLDLEEEIPLEVYKAVAEILAFIYRLSNRPLDNLQRRMRLRWNDRHAAKARDDRLTLVTIVPSAPRLNLWR